MRSLFRGGGLRALGCVGLGLVLLGACADDRAGTDAGELALDGGTADARVATDGSAACGGAVVNEPCDSIGDVCETAACRADACDEDCVVLACEGGIDGSRRWTRRTNECPDAGTTDAGTTDAGTTDAGTTDAGPPGPCAPRVGPLRSATLRGPTTSVGTSSILWDGSRYVVVWGEIVSADPVVLSLFIAFANGEGELLGTPRRIFGDDARATSEGAIALGEDGLGLVFIRGNALGQTVANRALFVRLDRDGAPLPGTEIPLTAEHPTHASPGLAYNPTLHTWTAIFEGTEPLGGGYVASHIFAVRLDRAGALLDASPLRLDALVSARTDTASVIQWTGDRFAVAIGEYMSVSSTRVVIVELDPSTGAITRRIVVASLARPGYLSLATDGAHYGVAWAEIDWAQVYFARAAVGGEVIGAPIPLGAGSHPSLLFDGTIYRAVFDVATTEVGEVWRARLAATGALLDAGMWFAGASPYATGPLLASDGCNDIAVWTLNTPSTATLQMHVPASP